jgi:uncharacterized protein (DUF924 family)
MPAMDPGDVLDFWLGQDPKTWFGKDRDFDAVIRDRFLTTYEAVVRDGIGRWIGDARSCLALVILLDQFPRNMFRNMARAFESDGKARSAARQLVAHGWDRTLAPRERMFAYLPFEHSESLADQETCLTLMATIAIHPDTADMPRWARAHLDIIRRFGRFPHRNAALGRPSTPEEAAFLRQPGSGF